MSSDKIFELAMNKVKTGQSEEFKSAREAFIVEKKKEKGIGLNGIFQSIFTVYDQPDWEVYVEFTEWESIEAFQQAVENLTPTPALRKYTATFDRLAYTQVKTEDGGQFDINDILKQGQVVEFAVRYVRPDSLEIFLEKRAAFFGQVAEQEGYELYREFASLEGDDLLAIIVWKSADDFRNWVKSIPNGIPMSFGKTPGEEVETRILSLPELSSSQYEMDPPQELKITDLLSTLVLVAYQATQKVP